MMGADLDRELFDILRAGAIALRLLSARLLTIVALLLTFGLFAWAMATQTPLGCIIAVAWGLIIFLPILFIGRGGSDHAFERRAERPEDGPHEGGAEAGA